MFNKCHQRKEWRASGKRERMCCRHGALVTHTHINIIVSEYLDSRTSTFWDYSRVRLCGVDDGSLPNIHNSNFTVLTRREGGRERGEIALSENNGFWARPGDKLSTGVASLYVSRTALIQPSGRKSACACVDLNTHSFHSTSSLKGGEIYDVNQMKGGSVKY